MWKEGTIGIPQKDGGYKAVHYWIKVYEEGSRFGINGGKISKLMLKLDGEIIANYDRGWDVKNPVKAGRSREALFLVYEGRTDYGGGYFLCHF